MTERNVLSRARKALKMRRFPLVISLLESRIIDYRDSFDFFYILGTACMYVGDFGGANTYFKRARQIKVTSPNLMAAQAAIFLREGNTSKALEYYLEVLDYEPNNKIAKSALKFIRKKGDRETIDEWVDNGRIKQFYPDLGVNPLITKFLLVLLIFIIFAIGTFAFGKLRKVVPVDTRADLSEFILSADERQNSIETDLSGGVYKYILTSKEITNSYDSIRVYFNQYRDNAAQVEINRLLNSNASVTVRQKARLFMEYLKPGTFDTIKDNYSYKDVSIDVNLYTDCWVVWSGRISNGLDTKEGFICDLLVGYETLEKVEGIVPVKFKGHVSIDAEKPVKILGKLSSDNGRICLTDAAVYQNLGSDF